MVTGRGSLRPWDPIFWHETNYGALNAVLGNTPGIFTVACTINQAASQADPANTGPIVFDAVFAEAVTGFTTGDVTITGTAGGTLVATVVNSGNDINYTVYVTGMTSAGTVIANIPAGVCTSIATGGNNLPATSTDNTVTFTLSIGWKVAPGSDSVGLTSLTGRQLEAGDIGIAFYMGLATNPTDPAGWSVLATDNASGDATTYRVRVYAKVLDGSETSVGASGGAGDENMLVVVLDGSIWDGWEDPIAETTLTSTATHTPSPRTASGSGSVFIEAVFMRGNVSKTSSGFTGPAWATLHLEGTGSGTPPMLGLLVNNQSPGTAPDLEWFVTGIDLDFQSTGVVITP